MTPKEISPGLPSQALTCVLFDFHAEGQCNSFPRYSFFPWPGSLIVFLMLREGNSVLRFYHSLVLFFRSCPIFRDHPSAPPSVRSNASCLLAGTPLDRVAPFPREGCLWANLCFSPSVKNCPPPRGAVYDRHRPFFGPFGKNFLMLSPPTKNLVTVVP